MVLRDKLEFRGYTEMEFGVEKVVSKVIKNERQCEKPFPPLALEPGETQGKVFSVVKIFCCHYFTVCWITKNMYVLIVVGYQ